ncbi:MAG: peptidoglycan DD-metalloendopeptidase family protein [Firmicutes bacterium]|nr:peptidoglycan DD-metalloendopeptidase family protein [Bacillota bacterium]
MLDNNTELKIAEAQYIRNSHRKHSEKKRVHKTQRIVSTVVVMFCFAFLLFGGVKIVSAYTSAFQIVVEGEGLATLPTEKEAKDAIALYLEEQAEITGFSVVCGDSVKIERVPSREAEYISTKDAVEVLGDSVKVLAKAVAVCINGLPVMCVASENSAREAVEQAKLFYGRVGESGVEDVDVLERVGVLFSNVDPNEVLSVHEATNMLLFGKADVEYHYVETEGETFEYIANRYDCMVDDIKKSNPMIDSTNMAVGEPILLSEVEPLISVQVKRVIVSHEETPFETEQRDNYEIARGDKLVVTEGMPGEDEITTEIVERNGVALTQNRVSTLTLVEPVTRVVERGAKWVIASRASGVNSGDGDLGWPVNGKISSRYGYRSLGFHSGLDLESPIGTPIAAAKDGVVVYAEFMGNYGNLIKIDHGESMTTWYAHLQAFSVDVGDKVTRGQMIGTVGRTGRTTGAHVHFEVRIDNQHCNPLQFLEPRKVEILDNDNEIPEDAMPLSDTPESAITDSEIVEIEETRINTL